MSTTYSEAPQELLSLVYDTIMQYHHESLQDATFAVVMRYPAASSQGKMVYAKVSKFPEVMKPLVDHGDEFDFLMVISKEVWNGMSKDRREAMIDHELCHCRIDVFGKPQIVAHDVEEFAEIVKRHGVWNTELMVFGGEMAQLRLWEGVRNGEVKISTFGTKDQAEIEKLEKESEHD